MDELVSIIMPNYNCSLFLREALESVLTQTYRNWELIFVDDCSTDDSVSLVKSVCKNDSRIRIYENQKNMGAAFCRNRAIQVASGKWIAFLDSDDVWDPTKLERQISFMANNGYHFSYTNYKQIDTNSNDLGVFVTGPKVISRYKMTQFDYIGCLTVIYDQTFIKKIYVDERLKSRNDYALWLKVAQFSKCYLLNECLAYYRVRKNSISHRGIKKLIKSHYLMFRISEKHNPFVSCLLTLRNIFWSKYKKIKYVKHLHS